MEGHQRTQRKPLRTRGELENLLRLHFAQKCSSSTNNPLSRTLAPVDGSLLYDRSECFCAALITHNPRHLFTFIANCLALSHEHYVKQGVVVLKLLSVQNSLKRLGFHGTAT